MIDLFLTNNKTLFLDVKSGPSCSMVQDHRLVLAKIRIVRPKSKRKAGIKRYKLRKLNELENVVRLRETIEESYQEEDDEGDAEVLWNGFKTKLTEAADKILGEKKSYEGKKKITPWWSDEVKDSVKFKMIKFRRWMKTRTPEDRAPVYNCKKRSIKK